MALSSIEGRTSGLDVRSERIAAGTMGADHIVTNALGGLQASQIIDDADPRIIYYDSYSGQFAPSEFSQSSGASISIDGSYTVIGSTAGNGVPGAAAFMRFNGTAMGVLGAINPNGGMMSVYIDGVWTKGKVVANSASLAAPAAVNNPVITAADKTIPTLNNNLINFSNQEVIIGSEIIGYTAKTGNSLTGCTRGLYGTTPVPHYQSESIYVWGNGINTSPALSGAVSLKQLQWYNPFLSPGNHTVLIVADTNPNNGQARIYFDGFVTGPLLGAKNIYTNSNTMVLSFTTDANGHADIGEFVSWSSDFSPISVMGYTQTSPSTETSNTTAMGKLGFRYNVSGMTGQPFYYYHNGPANSSVVIMLTLAFVGQSV